jgi:hypothetical protein
MHMDFSEIYNVYGHSAFGKFYLMDGYLFKENRLWWHSAFGKFYLMDGYLFKENRLWFRTRSLNELFIHEAYGLTGHFGVAKTLKCCINISIGQHEKRCLTNLLTVRRKNFGCVAWTKLLFLITCHLKHIDKLR